MDNYLEELDEIIHFDVLAEDYNKDQAVLTSQGIKYHIQSKGFKINFYRSSNTELL